MRIDSHVASSMCPTWMVVNYSVVARGDWCIKMAFLLCNNFLEPGYALVAGVVVTGGPPAGCLVRIIDGVAVGLVLDVLEFLHRFPYGCYANICAS